LVGKLAVEYGEIEWLLDQLFDFVVDENQGYVEIVCNKLEPFRLGVASSIFNVRYGADIAAFLTEWKTLRKRSEDCQEEQNSVIHWS
jgi:hypothetical protein